MMRPVTLRRAALRSALLAGLGILLAPRAMATEPHAKA